MAYSSWSVVFGEQPSAAKWNILGTNDAHFNDLIGSSGTNTVLNNIPYQANTSNSVRDGVLIQHGYGVMAAGAAGTKSETVTFPTAYSAIPIVVVTAGGDDTAGSTTFGAGGAEDKSFFAYAHTPTATTFVAKADSRDGTSWAAGTTVFYHWLSIGLA